MANTINKVQSYDLVPSGINIGKPSIRDATSAEILAQILTSASNDDLLQRKAGVWTNRTITQLIADLALSGFSVIDSIANGDTTNAPSRNSVYDALLLKMDYNAPITGATHTKITYDLNGLITGGVDATTLDFTDSATKRFVTDTEKATWNALIGGSIFQTVWNANTNSPALTSSVGTKGFYYIVNVLGATNLDGITDWKVGDWAIFDGTVWRKVDNTDAVSSVNGLTGAVLLDSSNVPDTTDKRYITDAQLVVLGNTSNTNSGNNAPNTSSQPVDADLTAIAGLTPANDDFMQYKSSAWSNRTIAQVKADLGITDPLADVVYTQPSASTTWVLVHGKSNKPNFAFFNASGVQEYPLNDSSVSGTSTLTFGTSEIHTATLPGNGTSASIRNDNIITVLASAINTAVGVIDIVTAKTVNITMDANITSPITFSTTPTDGVPLRICFIKTGTAYTATLDASKFQGSVTNPVPSPLVTATANTKDTFDFIYYGNKSKMSMTGADLGA